jgi:hypothetical protein
VKRLEQQIVSAAAVVMGVAIGVLTIGLGLGIAGSPWELHLAAGHAAVVAVVLVGLIVVAIGVVLVIDLIDEDAHLGHRH